MVFKTFGRRCPKVRLVVHFHNPRLCFQIVLHAARQSLDYASIFWSDGGFSLLYNVFRCVLMRWDQKWVWSQWKRSVFCFKPWAKCLDYDNVHHTVKNVACWPAGTFTWWNLTNFEKSLNNPALGVQVTNLSICGSHLCAQQPCK